jgi:hypothetical protein
MLQTRCWKRNQRGSALIIVLASIAVMALLVVHITTWSEVMAKETKTNTELSMFKYVAESATEHALWMHIVDKRDYKNRMLLLPGTLMLQEDPRERWMADNKKHFIQVDDITVNVAIKDAEGGFNIASTRGIQTVHKAFLKSERDIARIQTIETFINSLLDYLDRGDGDTARINGMERPEYRKAGFDGLPRNGPIQLREELFWLPSSAKMAQIIRADTEPGQFIHFFEAIPQGNDSRNQRSSKPSFFSSPPVVLQYLASLSQNELQAVVANRRAYLENREELFANLGVSITARLKQYFSFTESGIVTIETSSASTEKGIQRTHQVTRYARLPKRHYRHR